MRWFGIVRGSLEVTENSAIRQSAYELLVAFHSNYVPILHRFWHITRYWSNVTDLNLPHLYFAPRWGWLRRNFTDIFGVRKLEFLRYRVAFCVILRSALLVQCRFVTDRQADRYTTTAYRASIASRCKMAESVNSFLLDVTACYTEEVWWSLMFWTHSCVSSRYVVKEVKWVDDTLLIPMDCPLTSLACFVYAGLSLSPVHTSNVEATLSNATSQTILST